LAAPRTLNEPMGCNTSSFSNIVGDDGDDDDDARATFSGTKGVRNTPNADKRAAASRMAVSDGACSCAAADETTFASATAVAETAEGAEGEAI
jgi:hypothetical protein